MSFYAGSAATYPSTITVLDDGDTADAAGIGAASFEALADRTAQWTAPRWIPLGSVPFTSDFGHFALSTPAVGGFMAVATATAAGDYFYCTLPGLVNGATIESIDVAFIPTSTARGAWPIGAYPDLQLGRSAIGPSGGTPAGPAGTGISGTYVPVSQADYQNGKFKILTASGSHVVDVLSYSYQLLLRDEHGGSAIPGNAYIAYRVNYA